MGKASSIPLLDAHPRGKSSAGNSSDPNAGNAPYPLAVEKLVAGPTVGVSRAKLAGDLALGSALLSSKGSKSARPACGPRSRAGWRDQLPAGRAGRNNP